MQIRVLSFKLLKKTLMLQMLTDKKDKYIHNLDQQLFNLRYWYTSFAKKIKKTYPTPDDILTLFPSRDDLVNKVQNITNDIQLAAFIRGIKDDIQEVDKADRNERLSLYEIRKRELSELSKQLSQLEHTRPKYKMNYYNRGDVIQKLSKDLDGSKDLFELSCSISDIAHDLSNIDSQIVDGEQYSFVREWLQPKYRPSYPKLLYSGKKDGMDAVSFHKKCDGKGATVTLLKVKSQTKSWEVYIIGGFADKAWCSADKYIESNESFLFSLTNKAKYPLRPSNEHLALVGNANYGPTFGMDDLRVQLDFSIVTMCACCYPEFTKMTSGSNNKGGGLFGGSNETQWQLLEIEVFSV